MLISDINIHVYIYIDIKRPIEILKLLEIYIKTRDRLHIPYRFLSTRFHISKCTRQKEG